MTKVIVAQNVNHAFRDALWWIKVAGVPEDSRNGPVLVAPGPVITEYQYPLERVLFNPVRDANPVFHLMESLWMLAGESKLDFILPFNARMASYGENGIQWGAYGRRWNGYFGVNQIQLIIDELTANPNSRRAVIGMWDPMLDLKHSGPDIPCNTHIYFDLRGGSLNMTVCCRSNDLLWGAYGANVVHLSILQEVIAHELHAKMGVYRQMSNNFHIYTDLPMAASLLASPPNETHDKYGCGVTWHPMLSGSETLSQLVVDCKSFIRGGIDMSTEFMVSVARPLRDSYLARRSGNKFNIPEGNVDWFVAYRDWLSRRNENVSE